MALRRLLASIALATVGLASSLALAPTAHADDGLVASDQAALGTVLEDVTDVVGGAVQEATGALDSVAAPAGSLEAGLSGGSEESGSGIRVDLDAAAPGSEVSAAAEVAVSPLGVTAHGNGPIRGGDDATALSVAASSGGADLLGAGVEATAVAGGIEVGTSATLVGNGALLTADATVTAGDATVPAEAASSHDTTDSAPPEVQASARTLDSSAPVAAGWSSSMDGVQPELALSAADALPQTTARTLPASSASSDSPAVLSPANGPAVLHAVEQPIVASTLDGPPIEPPGADSGLAAIGQASVTPQAVSISVPRTAPVPSDPKSPAHEAGTAAGSRGLFGPINDLISDITLLFGGSSSGAGSTGSTQSGGLALAILAAILAFGARLTMLRQWSRRTGLPEAPPRYVLVPPG